MVMSSAVTNILALFLQKCSPSSSPCEDFYCTYCDFFSFWRLECIFCTQNDMFVS